MGQVHKLCTLIHFETQFIYNNKLELKRVLGENLPAAASHESDGIQVGASNLNSLIT